MNTVRKKKSQSAIDFSAAAAAVSAERVQRGFTYPSFSGISPRNVDYAFRSYQAGLFYSALPIMEAVATMDAQVSTCMEKRLAMTCCADWEVFYEQDIDEAQRKEAEIQSSIIRDFLNTLCVSSATAQDENQGLQSLLRHIGSAIAYGYAAAAITWVPAKTASDDFTLHAEVMTCPLRFFEARERRLRICKDYTANAAPIVPGKWLIAHTQSTPLMLPTLFAYLFKATPLQDWGHTVEKFGIPFISAKTPAAYGDANWTAAENALRRVGSGFAGLFGKDVELEIHSLAQGNAPHAALIDYVDRKIAQIWLGGDLSTMSRGDNAVGSLAQTAQGDFQRKQDKAFVEQVVDTQLVRPLLDRVFGAGSRQYAFFRFKDVEAKDLQASILRIKTAKELGLEMSKAFVYSELGVPEPKPWEEIFEQPQESAPPPQQQDVPETEEEQREGQGDFSNASGKELSRSFLDAQARQFDALISRLRVLEQTQTEEDFQNAAKALEQDFPQIAGQILSRNDVAEAIASAVIDKIEYGEHAEFKNAVGKNGMKHDARGRFADKDYLDNLESRVHNVKDHLRSIPDSNARFSASARRKKPPQKRSSGDCF